MCLLKLFITLQIKILLPCSVSSSAGKSILQPTNKEEMKSISPTFCLILKKYSAENSVNTNYDYMKESNTAESFWYGQKRYEYLEMAWINENLGYFICDKNFQLI